MCDIDNNFFKTQDLGDTRKEYREKRDQIKKEWYTDFPQRYIGEVLHGNLHRHGLYYIEKQDKLFYDGLFYANKLEGYAQIFYNNGCNFQGLFKKNKRFGPGILTYPNGEQDVGLWIGQSLMRLAGVNEDNLMPTLATTPRGHLKLLKYRYLVPVCPKSQDVAYSILENLGASEKVLQESYKLYNTEAGNKSNIFFDRKLFDSHFYSNQDCFIDIANDDEEDSEEDQAQEEEPATGPSDVNAERIRQISEELENVESKLRVIKKKRAVVEKKVEECRACCQEAQAQRFASVEEEGSCTVDYPAVPEDPETELSVITPDNFSEIIKKPNATRNAVGHETDTDFRITRAPNVPLLFTERRGLFRAAEHTKAAPKKTTSETIIDDAKAAEDVMRKASSTTTDTDTFIAETNELPGPPPLPPEPPQPEPSEDDRYSNLDYTDNHFRESSSSSNDSFNIKTYLMDSCQCDEVLHVEDLHELEWQLELITKDEMFFECIKSNLTRKLQMHLKKFQNGDKVKTRKLLVKDVLAWNNEECCMRMLRHSFRHRRSEYMVNFQVSDLFSGSRSEFGAPGIHERNCKDFLRACSRGDAKAVFNHVNRHDVDVNVCDGKGNNGVFFASVNVHPETIRHLVNLGAKVNQENDEGLLPLSMCFLIYLAEKHHVADWEKSFLPDIEPMSEQKQAYNWYPNTSLLAVLAKYEGRGSLKRNQSKRETSPLLQTTEARPYLFDTGYMIPTEDEIMDLADGVSEKLKKTVSMINHRQTIDFSIRALLNCGANPNIGEAPLPVLILSLFTGDANLVECVLAANADVQVTIGEDLTALHIVASLKCIQANVAVCNLLLEYACDPTLRTTAEHWTDQKPNILGKNIDPVAVEDLGKNPLHILCMRKDFLMDRCSYFQQMAMVLCNSSIDCNEKYLGHTPLSLAVLVGNKPLVEALMKIRTIDAYQSLGYGMGNVLTIYILKRYQDLIPPNAREVLKYLVDLNVNPLSPVGEFDNVVAFMDKEHEVYRGKMPKKGKSTEVLKNTSRKQQRKGSTAQNEIKNYIKELSRDTIIRYIQLLAVENLYNLVEEDMTEHGCVKILAEFLTPFVVTPNLQNLFKHGRIKTDRYDKNICFEIIDIVNRNIPRREPSKKFNKSAVKPIDSKNIIINTSDYVHSLDIIDLEKPAVHIKFGMFPPGLDKVSKYAVCFHCLTKQDKLLVCPRCQLIYFCSDSCNTANLKLRTAHTCNINFYSSELKKLESPKVIEKQENLEGAEERETLEFVEEQESLAQLYKRVRESCEKRRLKKLKEANDLARKQLEEEMKNDVYGTKMLKRRKQLRMMLERTSTMISLAGSMADYIPSDEGLDNQTKPKSGAGKKTGTPKKKQQSKSHPTKSTESKQKDKCMTDKKYDSNLKQPSSQDKVMCKKNICICVSDEECVGDKQENKYKLTCSSSRRSSQKIRVKRKASAENSINWRKLRKVPVRYQEFIELLTRYFPDIDFSTLFLPYACYSNGHLYYKFLDEDFYTKTYSMM